MALPLSSKPLTKIVRISGTSYFPEEISRLFRKYSFEQILGEVCSEPTNPVDTKAKAVYIENELIGYIPKELVDRFPEGQYAVSFCYFQTIKMKTPEISVQIHF
jgi:hypothetical protein